MGEPVDHRRWFLGPIGVAGTQAVRLICVPYAGGGPMVFRSWTAALQGIADVVTVCLPGRAHRWAEAHYKDLPPLVNALADAVTALPAKPTVIFGHSLGALIGFELTRRLAQTPYPPVLLVASACSPPSTLASRPDHAHTRSDDALIAELRRMGATPEHVLANDELMSLLLPTIRADFALSEGYRYAPGPAVPTPVITLAGRQDPLAPPDTMRGWERETSWVRHVKLDGGHMFLHSEEATVLAELRSGIRSVRRDGR
jgi:surfactin synthase thioesterase subunit